MGLPVVTIAAGGLPVVDVTAVAPRTGTPVTEAANGRGVAVTKVAAGNAGMPVVYETIGVVAPVLYAAFDPATVLNATLSTGNLTVTHTGSASNEGARGLPPATTTGKIYFEITRVNVLSGGDSVGMVTAAGTYSNVLAGTNCTCLFVGSGNISSNNGGSGKNVGTVSAGTVIGVAVDLIGRKAWFRKGAAGLWNGLAIGSEDPASGLGGVVVAPTVGFLPVVGFGSGTGAVYTANFGASAFTGAVPAGFIAGWPA